MVAGAGVDFDEDDDDGEVCDAGGSVELVGDGADGGGAAAGALFGAAGVEAPGCVP